MEEATALYVQSIEPIEGRGTITWRATFNLSHDFSPTVLRDGRVLFSSWQQQGHRRPPHGMIALMTMNWAGTGLNAFYGNHQGKTVKSMACEMPDRKLVFIESDGSSGDGSGQLASVSFKRPLRSHQTLSDGKGRYKTPHAFPGSRLGVSYTPNPGSKSYGIHLFSYKRNTAGRVVYDDPEWDDIDAVPVVPREEPMGRITIVVDSKETGSLQCLNVYDSDRPESATIEEGDVKRVRLVEGIAASHTGTLESGANAAEARFANTRILGEAPVEPDGSFYVEVPGDTPFYIQALDGDGMALQTMRGWMWVRKGSRRGCIGCHENKELAPENRATQALIKAEPTRLLTPPEERRTATFREKVAPIIQERCLGCHGGRAPRGDLYLGEGEYTDMRRAYETLTLPADGGGEATATGGKYVHRGSARKSPLMWLLFDVPGEETGRGGTHSHPHVSLSDREKRAFVEWIDLGGQWDNAPDN
jgi:hypothetical protein